MTCTCDTGSMLKRSTVQSKVCLTHEIIAAAAAAPSYSAVMPVPNASDIMFQATNVNAAGGIVGSFKLECLPGSVTNEDGSTTTYVIDDAGNYVDESTLVEAEDGTQTGTELEAGVVDALACLIKERIGGCGQVDTDAAADPVQLEGDTGEVGNSYILELQLAEIGSQSAKCKCAECCFVRVCVTAAAAGDFVLSTVLCGKRNSQGIQTSEVVA